MAISEEEVMKSFGRVKEDILQIKRSLNKQTFAVEGLNKSAGSFLQKDEFYAFIKRLGSKIEELEDVFPSKSDREDVQELAAELGDELASLKQAIARRDDFVEEVRQARVLRGKVLELEGNAVSKADFSKDSARLKADIAAIRASGSEKSAQASALSASLSRLSKDFAELNGRLNSLVAQAVVKDDIASFTERIESSVQDSSRGFASLKRDVDRKLSDVDRRMAFLASVEETIASFSEKLSASARDMDDLKSSVSRKFVDRQAFERSLGELRSSLNEARQLLESSMSEVNLDDYVNKRSLRQQLSSLQESVTQAVSSGLSGRNAKVEEQISALRQQLSALQSSVEKQLGRELQKFAQAKQLKELGGQVEKLSSESLSASDFYSNIQRVESSSGKAADDFRKEVRKQREIYEERIKSLESFHRSSNEALRDEIGELRSQIKALTKAGAQARSAIEKVSASAVKAATKSAADLIEEVDRDGKSPKKPGKGPSALAVSLVIIVLLLIGSFAYVSMRAGEPVEEEQGQPEAQQPEIPEPGLTPNVTLPPLEIPVSNETAMNETPANEAPEQLPPVTNESLHVDRSQQCKDELECTLEEPGRYRFDCYFDESNMLCRCYTGGIEKCPGLAAPEASAEEEVEEAAASPGLKYYGIAAFVLLVVAFFAYRSLFVKDEEPEGKKEKPDKAEKASRDEDVIDLEEFFEKKENKKK